MYLAEATNIALVYHEAIRYLVRLPRINNPALQQVAAVALENLALKNTENQIRIAKQNPMPTFIRLVQSAHPAVRAAATSALSILVADSKGPPLKTTLWPQVRYP